MVALLCLLSCAAGLLAGAPPLLCRARWPIRRPGLALGLWCAAGAGGLGCAGASLVWAPLLAVAARPAAGQGTSLLAACAVGIVGWAGLAGFGALASLVLIRGEPMTAGHRRTVALLGLLACSAGARQERLGAVTVVHVASGVPAAVSLPGWDPRIVVTSRLAEELTPGQLRAVIEHERAHLARGHGWIAGLAQLGAACLPAFGAREFDRATRLLVELVADDAAARVCGAEDLSAALAVLGALNGDEGMLLRSRRTALNPPRRPRPVAPAPRTDLRTAGR